MSRKIIFGLLIALAFVPDRLPGAEAPVKILRIGYLTANSSAVELSRIDAFRQGLRDRGYVEGQNVLIDYRLTDARFDRLPAAAAEWVRLNVDVLVANTTNAALAAKNATGAIPIFFIGVSDPVAAGLVDSFARPGGNITGLTNIASMLSGKRLELLKETVPKLSRVAVLWDPKNPGSTPQWKESEIAAKELSLQLYSINRLPAIYARDDFVSNGGLMSYGPSYAADGRDAARLVDKILKGTKPAELPVEQPTKFEFIVNLKTAKQIGLTIPPNVLARADRVIR